MFGWGGAGYVVRPPGWGKSHFVRALLDAHALLPPTTPPTDLLVWRLGRDVAWGPEVATLKAAAGGERRVVVVIDDFDTLALSRVQVRTLFATMKAVMETAHNAIPLLLALGRDHTALDQLGMRDWMHDWSHRPEMATAFGITWKELIRQNDGLDLLSQIALSQAQAQDLDIQRVLESRIGGVQFGQDGDHETVLNPYDLSMALERKELLPFWAEDIGEPLLESLFEAPGSARDYVVSGAWLGSLPTNIMGQPREGKAGDALEQTRQQTNAALTHIRYLQRTHAAHQDETHELSPPNAFVGKSLTAYLAVHGLGLPRSVLWRAKDALSSGSVEGFLQQLYALPPSQSGLSGDQAFALLRFVLEATAPPGVSPVDLRPLSHQLRIVLPNGSSALLQTRIIGDSSSSSSSSSPCSTPDEDELDVYRAVFDPSEGVVLSVDVLEGKRGGPSGREAE